MRSTDIYTSIAGNTWKDWFLAKGFTHEGIHVVGRGTHNCAGKTVEAPIHELMPLVMAVDRLHVEDLKRAAAL